MGFFDFFKKDKGKEVFKEDADAQARAEAIRKEIDRLGLPGDIKVAVEGSRVKVTGNVPDDATRQKLAVIVGNMRHIDSVDDSGLAGGDANAAQPKIHEVQSGETLSAIAKQYYGDPNAYNKIFEANKPMLKDPDEIYPGQVLIIPEDATASA
ncbi:peptidoglycan-binding protein LysM [Sphingomonas sabuli]|uniref:Potassium binding protein Kbp n=1 Tax=Sphingomonas sabuli TaxID=2764186 RepID=A0A7G9L3M9_9SPHN|nr:peptidoglycan-binding protein LysM [Sphingomonas sabuli]QNM83228.1 peptidoglycan-binding protein LysM [Sphingomonas sabuli]